jgi:hypothetical protein
MASTESLYIPKTAQEGLVQYHRTVSTLVERQWRIKANLRNIDLAYLREQDLTDENIRAKIANRYGDANKLQNITIPIIKPQVKSAVSYQAAVFLTDYPLFGVVADPMYMDAALQMQAVIEENSVRGSWARELLLFFQDGFKYNLSALEVSWSKVVTAAIETDISFKAGVEGKPKQIIWQGNTLKRWDPYNTYFDSRCEPYDIPVKGEFAGHTELMSRTALKSFIASLETKILDNIVPAFESPSLLNIGGSMEGAYGASYYLPQLNPDSFMEAGSLDSIDWMGWVGMGNYTRKGAQAINYRGLYEVSTEYVRLIPSDFNLRVPAPNTPQVWKLIIVNHSVVIYAERQTNAHEKIPVFFGCPSEDGLGYQTKSLAQDAEPFQQVTTALMNSVIASRRRAITDRVIYDPSRVSEAHMNSSNPSAKIPIRPAAYGKPVAEAVYQFPFRDDQAGIALQEIQALVQFGNVLNGQNQARQGQFVKGNKTDGQWESTMQNATSSDQMTALLYEAQVFTPLKEVIKINMLQYQTAGTIYSPSQGKDVQVDPLALRKAVLNFKITDGQLPKEKVISKDSMQMAAQVIGSSEALAAGYNVASLFSYLFKTENVDFKAFEKSQPQIAYEAAVNNWSQLAQLAIQKGAPFNVPQPVPQQFGYDPNTNDPASQSGLTQNTGTAQPSQQAQESGE